MKLVRSPAKLLRIPFPVKRVRIRVKRHSDVLRVPGMIRVLRV